MSKNFLDRALISIKPDAYHTLILFLLPLFNFLVGINVDLYAPSMPAIANYYDVSASIVKNTITITLIGLAIGCLCFGTLLDIYGRRRIILFSVSIYVIMSFLAPFCTSIHQLMWVRFFQGMMIAAISIGPRVLLIDHFSGHRLLIALMYTSLAYSLGPFIAPFIGGLVQHHFGWQANFLLLGCYGLIILILFSLYIHESFPIRSDFSLKKIWLDHTYVIKNRGFLATIFIVGITQIEQMIYPTLGPFLVEIELKRSAIIYGNSALIIGAGYLIGTLINRLLIRNIPAMRLIIMGFGLLTVGLMLLLLFALFSTLSLITLVLPFIILNFATGFIFANILGLTLRQFPQHAGIATALLSCFLVTISAIGLFFISLYNVRTLLDLTVIVFVLVAVQIFVFFTWLYPQLIKDEKNGYRMD